MKHNTNSRESKSLPAEDKSVTSSNKKEALWRPLYPFVSHYSRIGGFSCHYIDEGPLDEQGEKIRDAGSIPTLLFVHGNPTWSFYWRELIKAFRQDYRVVAIDHIGCGLSDKPAVRDYPYTLDRRVSDLSALIQKLNLQNVTLVAHDWGGAIGLGAAQRSPKRFSKLILMNTGAFPSDACPLRIRLCRTPWLGKFLVQGLNGFALAALRMASNRPSAIPREVRAGLIAPYDSRKHRVAVHQFVLDIPMSEKDRSWEKLLAIEEGLSLFRDTPVALIWGMQDWCFTGEFLKKFLRYFPTAMVHRIDQAGHYLVEDAPDEVIETIRRFLGNSPVSATDGTTKE